MKPFRVWWVGTTVAAFVGGVALGTGTALIFWQREPNAARQMPPPRVERSIVKEPAPPVICYLGRADTELKFRVADAFSHKPIGLARIVIDNLHLASELGSDSEAVTWSDGCARFTHHFLGLYRQRGKDVSSKLILQGPWIYVSADGYQTRTVPVTTVLKEEDLRIDEGWKSAVVVQSGARSGERSR